MIDYFNSIYTAVAKELRKQVPGILVTSEIDDRPVKRFPCVQIEENNNLPVHIDSAGHSKYAAVSLRVRVYSIRTPDALQKHVPSLESWILFLNRLNFIANRLPR